MLRKQVRNGLKSPYGPALHFSMHYRKGECTSKGQGWTLHPRAMWDLRTLLRLQEIYLSVPLKQSCWETSGLTWSLHSLCILAPSEVLQRKRYQNIWERSVNLEPSCDHSSQAPNSVAFQSIRIFFSAPIIAKSTGHISRFLRIIPDRNGIHP